MWPTSRANDFLTLNNNNNNNNNNNKTTTTTTTTTSTTTTTTTIRKQWLGPSLTICKVHFGFVFRYGRKNIFVVCILLLAVTGVAQVFSPDYYTFQFFVFLNAMGTAGVFPLAFVLGEIQISKNIVETWRGIAKIPVKCILWRHLVLLNFKF